MFVHSGASLHGHEYSPINNPATRRIPLVRSSFLDPIPRIATFDYSKATSTRPAARPSPGPSRKSEGGSFRELEGDTMSEDGFSYASEGSETTAGGTKKRRRRRTTSRSSTLYQFTHPAPTLTRQQRLLHIRPKLLLQLQRLSQDKRPIPSIDVLPSTVVVPRLMKKFPRILKGKSELGANDVIVVKSEDYDVPDNEDSIDTADDESLANREVLAVICQLRGTPTSWEICLSDGSIWYGMPMPKGVFEFVTTDPITGEKTTARWVQRVAARRHSSAPTASVTGKDISCEHKYTFSILQPNSRRHPILATITQKVLSIPDSYTTVSSSAGRYPPTSPIRMPTAEWQPELGEDDNLERTTIALDEMMRNLIEVTGVWLALRQGWCPYFKYEDVPTTSPARPLSLSVPGSRTRSSSHTHDSNKGIIGDTRASTPESSPSSYTATGGKHLRSNSHIFRNSPSSTPPASSNLAAPLPRRAVSTGTAFMQRAAARRAGHPPSTVASESEGEAAPSPVHAATSDVIIGHTDYRSMPSPPSSVDPSAATPGTPTKPFHRRVQSVFMSSSPVRKSYPDGAYGQTNGHPPSFVDPPKQSKGALRPGDKKPGKWNSLIRFLRRSDSSAR